MELQTKTWRIKMSNFKRYRVMIGMKQNELARLAGVAPSVVAVLERKGIFDTRTASRYASVMKCNPLFLLDGLDGR